MTDKTWFLAGIVLYALVSLVSAAWTYRTFGTANAIGLLILSLPAAMSLRMLLRWSAQRSCDFVLLAVLCVIDLVGVGFLLPIWYDSGLGKRHQHDLKNIEFIQTLTNDPAFAQIQAQTGKKGIVFLSGHVKSDADLRRLEALTEQREISAMLSVASEH